ncbi:hypothetical protein B9479_006507 [Cryptococcus floricola]|uniref:Riboflavin kinase n=1 Tax=Cryptococcus floricola TaxID=2591691 RepID=A0A5D3AQ38_9TREE|nr:hypothetical protein B9479_006507 [Cryptococcus floricola]
MPPKADMAPVSRESRPNIVGPDSPEDPYPMQLEGAVTKGFGRGARFLGIPTGKSTFVPRGKRNGRLTWFESANLPDESLDPLNALGMTGIYYGYARIHPSTSTPLPSAFPTPTTSLPGSKASSPPPPPPGAGGGEVLEPLPTVTAPYPPEHHAQRWSGEDEKVWPMVMSVGWNPYFNNEKITAEVHIMHPFKADFYGHHMSVLVLGYIRPELNYVSKEALIEDIKTDARVALNSLARPAYAALAKDKFLTKEA